MKCPKCGFNSFDYLDNCKKCGNDLVVFKAKHGLRSLFFPGTKPVREPTPPEAAAPEEAPLTEASSPTDFGFGFMEEQEPDTLPDPPCNEANRDAVDEGIALSGDFSFDETGEEFALENAGEEDLPPLKTESEVLPAFDGPDDFSFFDSAEEPGDLFGEGAELPSWDELGDDLPEGKPAARKEPSDPFEPRESAAAERIPEIITGHPLGAGAALTVAMPDPDRPPTVTPADTPPEPMADFPVLAEPAEPGDGLPPRPSARQPPAEDQEEPLPSAFLVGRLGALLADLLLVGSVLGGFLLLGQHLLEPQHPLLLDPKLLLRLSVPYFLLIFLGCFGYFTVFHLLLGQTPGKMLFGLGVETLDGSPLSPAQAFLRSVGGLAGWCLGGLGVVWILIDPGGRGWNDRLAGTRVVNWEEELPEPQAEGSGAAAEGEA